MTIVDFFTKLSSVLEDFRIKKLSRDKATQILTELEADGKKEGIQHKIDIDKLLNEAVSGEFDEEASYDDYMYSEASYDGESEEGESDTSY